MMALVAMLTLVALGFLGGLMTNLEMAAAQSSPPPASTPAPALPDWVAKYAGMQEQAARSCQIQLAQEQTKIDELTKQLADAKAAAAKATEAPKK